VSTSPPAGWYPDPAGGSTLRYWDAQQWTEHVAAPQSAVVMMSQPWKGAKIGRPETGPGSLADPARRFVAQLIDLALVLPIFVLLLVVTLLIAAPHFGPIFPIRASNADQPSSAPPGFLWIYVTIFGSLLITGLTMVAYQTITTATLGRSFGKRWLHIRPVRLDLAPLGWGRSFGRAALYEVSWLLSWIGLLDPLWCLWDEQRQCIHDKAVDSIVINDLDGSSSAPGAAQAH